MPISHDAVTRRKQIHPKVKVQIRERRLIDRWKLELTVKVPHRE
ncbi:hypothetical protein ACFQJD_16725 [Haloplanus sp. GCM10025708]